MRSEQPVIFWTLILAVIFAPLPFASIYTWSWSLIACVIGALVAAWSLRALVGAQKPAVGLRPMAPFIVLLAMIAGWAALQTVTWMPAAWHHPLWDSASRALGVDLAGRVSLNPEETLSALTRLLTCAGIFWLALQYGRRTFRAEQIFHAIVIAGVAYGLWGQLQPWLGVESRLGLPGPNDGWSAWGAAADGHAYAAYLSLALLSATSLVLAKGGPVPRRLSAADMARRLVDGSGASWPLLAMWLLLLGNAAVFHAGTDAIALWAAMAALFAVALIGRLARLLRVAAFAVSALLVVAGVAAIEDQAAPVAGGPASGPSPSALSAEAPLDRLQDLSRDAIADSPLLGTGYGTFEDVFRFYRTSDFPDTVLHARSSYLEMVLELGAPAALAALLLLAGLLVLTLAGAVKRQRDSAYAAGGFVATILIGLHAAFDYSLQVPAVAVTYSLLLGAACAQSWSSRREDDDW